MLQTVVKISSILARKLEIAASALYIILLSRPAFDEGLFARMTAK